MLIEKDMVFRFDEACLKAFEELKRQLIVAPIIVALDWTLWFDLMCDTNDHSIGTVLGKEKIRCFTLFIMRVRPLMTHK